MTIGQAAIKGLPAVAGSTAAPPLALGVAQARPEQSGRERP